MEVRRLARLPAALSETSALALDRDAIWTLNDSGNGPWLYRLDRDGRPDKRVHVKGAVNIDWEAMAASKRDLYVVDCGNNAGTREWLQFYRISWAALRAAVDGGQVAAHRGRFRYSDPTPRYGRRDHDNDCEAAVYMAGKMWLWTKGWHSQHSRLYNLDPNKRTQALLTRAEWSVRGLVTGADFSEQYRLLAVLGYRLGGLSVDAFVWLVPVRDGMPRWGDARYFALWPAGQWEGVVWRGDRLLLTREKSVLGDAWLGEVDVPLDTAVNE